MSLEAGRRLGLFEVIEPLGAGGMGEVYRARDTKLGRDVAIKVLPESFASSAERVSRFEREARLLAALNHPGIAAIYGFEQSASVHFLVLELVEGRTLAQRIDRGSLPQREALEIARQIAEALEAAHEKGIVHRDLKPSNIKLTLGGKVKLLDFGLAKALDTAAPDTNSHVATETGAPTREGVILGTAPYMSPEQARGEIVDKRTDIWAFGCVLYEMLTGRRAFPGPTRSDSIASVLARDPDWAALPPVLSPIAGSLLRRCLHKDRHRRLHDVADARIEIEDALAKAEPLQKPSRSPWRRTAVAVGVGAALVAGLALVGSRRGSGHGSDVRSWFPKRLALQLPAEARLAEGEFSIAFSPDGRAFTYRANDSGHRLYLRRLDSLNTSAIPGTEDAFGQFFSPDGRRLAFFADGKLKTVVLGGGLPAVVCDAPDSPGGSWAPDDTIVFTPRGTGGLYRVPASGGEARSLTVPERPDGDNHRFPEVLPGGKAALFTIMTASGRDQERAVAVVSLDTGRWRVLERNATSGRYSPSGHVLFVRSGALYAVPFDLGHLETVGKPIPVLEGIHVLSKFSGHAFFALSPTGMLAYVPENAALRERELVWVDHRGRLEPATTQRRAYLDPALSPDGRKVAVTVEGEKDDVWILDLALQTWSRPSPGGDNNSPIWSPDGGRVAFSSNRAAAYNVFWAPFDGSAPAEQLTSGSDWHTPLSFAHGGGELLYLVDGGNGLDVNVLSLKGGRQPRPFLNAPEYESRARVSPDGRWVTYTAGAMGHPEVFVQPYPGPGAKWPVSSGGGTSPHWSRDGRDLFFVAGGRMLEAAIHAASEFQSDKPRLLFDATPFEEEYDVAPDGRFLMVRDPSTSDEAALPLVVIPDWFTELTARLNGSAPGSGQ